MHLLHVLLVCLIARKVLPAGEAASLLVTVNSGDMELILGLAVTLPATHIAGEGVPLLHVAVSTNFRPEHCIAAATLPQGCRRISFHPLPSLPTTGLLSHFTLLLISNPFHSSDSGRASQS